MVEMLDDRLLEKFISSFYGYGNYRGDYWFIGKEEGGGGTVEEIRKRINSWSTLGCKELEDLFDYHQELGLTQCFGEQAKLQRTWKMLVRALLRAKGQEVTNNAIRKYQGQNLARLESETCLLELLPLPSPNTGEWLYSAYSKLQNLVDRYGYRNCYARDRADHIRKRVLEHKPKAVVFYSSDLWYQQWWQLIAEDVTFRDHEITHDSKLWVGENSHTVFIIAKHPVGFGVNNDYFNTIGTLIASHR